MPVKYLYTIHTYTIKSLRYLVTMGQPEIVLILSQLFNIF